jgi:8-oxo-dGTP diphosphatase
MKYCVMEKTIFGQKCIIFDKKKKKLLLIKRSDYKKDGGLWDFTGGSVNYGEDSKIAIRRETLEETKIILNKVKIIDLHSRLIENKSFFIFALYYCEDFTYEKIKLSEEHTEYEWFNLDEFKNLKLRKTVEKVKDIVIEYLNSIVF